MNVKTAFLATAALCLAACGSADDPQTADEQFDAALEEFTRTYFFHVPETLTYFGLSEEVAPDAAGRLMDHSPEGESARRQEMETALANLMAADPAQLSGDRSRIRDIISTVTEGQLAPAKIVDYGRRMHIGVFGLTRTRSTSYRDPPSMYPIT